MNKEAKENMIRSAINKPQSSIWCLDYEVGDDISKGHFESSEAEVKLAAAGMLLERNTMGIKIHTYLKSLGPEWRIKP